MRYLGIDYGTKRIGVALSDEKGKMAFAHSVIPNLGERKNGGKNKKICAENFVGKIILGKSLNYKGEPNPIMAKIEPFKGEAGKRNRLAGCLRKRNAHFGRSEKAAWRREKKTADAKQKKVAGKRKTSENESGCFRSGFDLAKLSG